MRRTQEVLVASSSPQSPARGALVARNRWPLRRPSVAIFGHLSGSGQVGLRRASPPGKSLFEAEEDAQRGLSFDGSV